jgi:hypothetical protein
MGFLGFGKKDRVIDLSERYKRDLERAEQAKVEQASETSATPLAFFDASTATSDSSPEVVDLGAGEERKKRLAKRIMEMTERVEDLSNQVYHLQQRLELIERKLDIRRV